MLKNWKRGNPVISGGHLLPPADNTYDLGSLAYSWRNAYIETAVYATSVVGNWSPSADDTYWLGTATYGWKGLHMPDTAIADAPGYVVLSDNTLLSYVGLKAGSAVTTQTLTSQTTENAHFDLTLSTDSSWITGTNITYSGARVSSALKITATHTGTTGGMHAIYSLLTGSNDYTSANHGLIGTKGVVLTQNTAVTEGEYMAAQYIMKKAGTGDMATGAILYGIEAWVYATGSGTPGTIIGANFGYHAETSADCSAAGTVWRGLQVFCDNTTTGANVAEETTGIHIRNQAGTVDNALSIAPEANTFTTGIRFVSGGGSVTTGIKFGGSSIGGTANVTMTTGIDMTEVASMTTSIITADDTLFKLGTTGDQVFLNRSTGLAADTTLSGVLISTPESQAIAANSLMISNITEDGDIAMYVNDGGTSKMVFWADGSEGDLALLGHDRIGFWLGGTLEMYLSTAYLVLEGVGLHAKDETFIALGTGYDGGFIYTESDDNANMFHLGLPHVDEDGNNVAVLALIDRDALASDLGGSGIDLSGKTEPTLVIGNETTDAWCSLDAGDDGAAQSKGLYFHPAADEDVEILNLSVTETPRLFWDDSNEAFSTTGARLAINYTELVNDGGGSYNAAAKITAINNLALTSNRLCGLSVNVEPKSATDAYRIIGAEVCTYATDASLSSTGVYGLYVETQGFTGGITADWYGIYIFNDCGANPGGASACIRLDDANASNNLDMFLECNGKSDAWMGNQSNAGSGINYSNQQASANKNGWLKVDLGGDTRYIQLYDDTPS